VPVTNESLVDGAAYPNLQTQLAFFYFALLLYRGNIAEPLSLSHSGAAVYTAAGCVAC
jgi:hypothetical protein